MGMGYLKSLVISIAGLGLAANVLADNRILERLEKGEVVSQKTGASFFVQSIVNKEPEKVVASFLDFKKLSNIFPQVAFSRPYVTQEGRQFLYLKLRGLGDGLGVLMEVKNANPEAFANARELVASSEIAPARDTSAEVSTREEENELQLRKEIDKANASGAQPRFLGASGGIVLEGPINEVMELPGVRISINLGFAPYTSIKSTGAGASKASALARKTYLVAKVAFGNQMPKEQLGDYRGFGDQRLSLAQSMGVNVLESLKETLEKL